MRKRVRLIPVIVLVGALLVGFFWVSSNLVTNIQETDALYQQTVATSNSLETRQNELKTLLASANSEAFIEKQARALYDYMKPDELRLVITNPEVLYGTDGK
ncbi:MAG: septum formation initiator family protein [Candidatus Limiplasma sp.]|nr:septum formation initiator family protein [Candidatus Limiplasma sp.]